MFKDKQAQAEPVFYAHALCLEQYGKGEITSLHGHNRKACDEQGEVLVPLYRHPPAEVVRELVEVLKVAHEYAKDPAVPMNFDWAWHCERLEQVLIKAKEHGL